MLQILKGHLLRWIQCQGEWIKCCLPGIKFAGKFDLSSYQLRLLKILISHVLSNQHLRHVFSSHAVLPEKREVHLVGHCGSVVACAIYRWEITGLITSLAEFCWDAVLLGKGLCPHVHSLNPGVSRYLVGQWRLVCLHSSMHWKWQLDCMLPGELRWHMNEEVLSSGGNCV